MGRNTDRNMGDVSEQWAVVPQRGSARALRGLRTQNSQVYNEFQCGSKSKNERNSSKRRWKKML